MRHKPRVNRLDFGRTGAAVMRHCGCDVLPWEDCEHTAWDTRAPEPDAACVEALTVARAFHEAYERLAPLNGYETRKETRHFDPNTANGKTMLAVCAELLETGVIRTS